MRENKQHLFRSQPYDSPTSQAEWEVAAARLLDEGQAFLAFDLARNGLARYPDSLRLKQSAALAMIWVGALEEALKLLEPLCPPLHRDPQLLQEVYHSLQSILPAPAPPLNSPEDNLLERMDHFVNALERILASAQRQEKPDEETLGMLARIYKDKWRHSGDKEMARRSRDMYHYSYRATGGYYTGINAATMSLLIGDVDLAQALARQVLEQCRKAQAEQRDDYWLLVTMGEAELLLGNTNEAIMLYRQAAQVAGSRHALIISSRQQLLLMKEHGIKVPPALLCILLPPCVVVFVGHMIDAPDRPIPRFPAELEGQVAAQIADKLAELEARIGYCSAACGSDILFIEAMLARGAEVNVILPFAEEDFIHKNVAFAGERWLIRYRNAIKLAHSVSFVTKEPFLGDNALLDFMARIFHGYAELRAHTLLISPRLLAVWDGVPTEMVGRTADFIRRWPYKNKREIIRLDSLTPPGAPRNAPPAFTGRTGDKPRAPQGAPTYPGQRRICTMLFADVVGYSKLEEASIPAFLYEFWMTVADRLTPKPLFVNTWGDAIFAVMEKAQDMMEYALSLQKAVKETPWKNTDARKGIDARIALHVGPIFEAKDPITQRLNYYGSHVNRAARLEPITVPGHIYATEQFVALLMSEVSGHRAVSKLFSCEYLGVLSLAKDFDEQVTYHIRGTD